MKSDIFTPFANAASQTFKLLLDVEANTVVDGSFEIAKSADEVSVSIGITGDLSDRNIICDILPPEIIGAGELSTADKAAYLFSAMVNTSIGNVEVQLRLKM